MKTIYRIFFVVMALIWFVAGVCCIIYPEQSFFWTQWITYALKLELWGIIAVISGLLFIFGSWVSGWQNFISVIGLLSILKGLFFLITPNKHVFTLLTMWFTASHAHYRLMGGVLIILSALLVKALTVRHGYVK